MVINSAFAYSLDKNKEYGKNVVTTIAQMLTKISNEHQYDIYIITDDKINNIEEHIRRFNKNINGRIIKVEPTICLEKIKTFSGGKGAFFRIYLPDILPSVDKIAYFDTDIFFNADISDFYNFDLDENYIGGITDIMFYQGMNNDQKILSDGTIKGKVNEYICSGVTLMNLKAMRENDVVNKLLNEIKNNHPFPDQDSLNIVCKGKIHSLPLEWGLFNDFKYIRYTKDIGLTKNEITKIFKNPKLIHQTRPKFGIKNPIENFKIVSRLKYDNFTNRFVKLGKKLYKLYF